MNLSSKHKYKHMSMLSLCVYYDLYDWRAAYQMCQSQVLISVTRLGD